MSGLSNSVKIREMRKMLSKDFLNHFCRQNNKLVINRIIFRSKV